MNNSNLTPFDLANQYNNFELAKQIRLHKEGKPIDEISWILSNKKAENKYKITDALNGEETNNFPYRKIVNRTRPATMIEDQFKNRTEQFGIFF